MTLHASHIDCAYSLAISLLTELKVVVQLMLPWLCVLCQQSWHCQRVVNLSISPLSAVVSTLLLVKPIDISSLNGCAPIVQNKELCIEDASALIKQHPRRADLSCTMSTYVECYQQSWLQSRSKTRHATLFAFFVDTSAADCTYVDIVQIR